MDPYFYFDTCIDIIGMFQYIKVLYNCPGKRTVFDLEIWISCQGTTLWLTVPIFHLRSRQVLLSLIFDCLHLLEKVL